MMSSSPLQQLIIERIQREGPLPFAEYMRIALYEPGHGYYVSGPPRIGWEAADYYTSNDIFPLFAHCMGRQLYQMWEQLGRPAKFPIVEQGAGRGDLAKGIGEWAVREPPEFGAALEYRVEDLRMGQDARDSDGPRLESPFVILSNELIDAFPVHIIEHRQKRLYEVYVTVQDGRLGEILEEPSSDEVATYLDCYKIPWQTFPDGWRAEINLDAHRWLERSALLLQQGFLLTIDYGDKARALYTPERRRGTLACYFQHQMTERPLIRPGEQDITAHVNFSALLAIGRRLDLHLKTFTTQRLWLTNLGIYEELERLRTTEYVESVTARATDRGQVALFKWYNLRQGVLTLTDPYGMGNFKVLILGR